MDAVILYIGQNSTRLNLINGNLNGTFEVIASSDLTEAEKILVQKEAGLVLIESGHPDIALFDSLRIFRQRYNIPVVLLTTNITAELAEQAENSGVAGILSNTSASPDYLVETLRSLIFRNKNAGPVFKMTTPGQANSILQFFDHLPVAYQTMDENGYFLDVNDAWMDMFGYSREEIEGKWFGNMIESSESLLEKFPLFLKQGYGNTLLTVIHKNGNKRTVALSAKVEAVSHEKAARIHCILQDPDVDDFVEKLLREREEKYQRIAENISDVVWVTDLSLNTTYVSRSAQKIFGETIEENLSKKLIDKFHPDSVEKLRNMLKQELERENDPEADISRTKIVEVQRYHKDGRLLWVSMNVSFVRDAEGKIIGFEGVSRDITEMKEQEKALRTSEELMRSIFRVAPVGIGTVQNRILTEVNPMMCSMLGYSREELIGQNSRMLYRNQEEYDHVGKVKYEQIALTGSGYVETLWMRKDGKLLNILLASTPVNKKDQSKGVVFSALDITERKQTQLMLAESEERYRLVMNNSLDAIMLTIPDGGIIAANQAACQMFGMTEEEICSGGRAGIVDATDPRLAELIKTREAEGKVTGVLTFIRKDGSRFEGEMSSVIFRNSKGEPRTSMMIRDISERMKAERMIRESEAKYRMIVENQTDLIVKLSKEGEFLFVSPSYCRMFGKCEDELIGRKFYEVIEMENYEDTLRHFQSLSYPPHYGTIEERMLTTDGWKWLAWIDTAILDENRNVAEIIGVGRDITRRKQAEQELKETSIKFREIFNATSEAIFIYDAASGTMLECNQRALDLYGFDTKEELLTRPLGSMSADTKRFSRESAEAIIERARREGVQTFEWITRRRNGSDFWNEISLKTAHIAGSERIITIERDITERKKNQITIQDQLNELQRWQETTLGREMRIIDLKKEVNSLLAELDLPLKYHSVL